MNKYSFKKGWLQVKQGEKDQVRAQLMDALNVTSRSSFSARVNGNVIPSHPEVKSINHIFGLHDITDVWDNDIES